jgi:cell division protein FtsI (penicillin-binding protein 3)
MYIKAIVTLVFTALLVSCTKQNEITPQLEKELAKTVFQNEAVKKDNYSIETAIDSSIQNSANQALLASLKEYEAENGFVVIMETNTGKIKSLIGLEKNGASNYVKSKNVAIDMPIEPGSLLKPFNLMSLLGDNKADTSSVYDANGGKISYFGSYIKDRKTGSNKLSLRSAFLNSSNTIFAQAIDNAYKNNPQQYIDNFQKFGLSASFSQISSKSIISSPKSDSWAGITLPWMGFGYGLQVTPIQLLTYYNSIANEGVMVEPLFLNAIKKEGESVKEYTKPIVVKTSTSKKSNVLLKSLLRDAVAKGACKNVDSDKITISGYAATTQINYSKGDGTLKYASSFVGYFPSDKPKYTILVYINNPKTAKGYYGSVVAGTVVKSIGEKLLNLE